MPHPVSLLLAQSLDSSNTMQFFGIKLVGFNPENARKLLFTVAFVAALLVLDRLARRVARMFAHNRESSRVVFWSRQGISVLFAVLGILCIVSIWFDNPTRLATFMGLVSAGVAFALQKPISALAGYIVILRGKTFNVGDRITMGGVRGDVIALRFTQTTIMEMGEPPAVQSAAPAVWVHSRQYTGRLVTVSNSVVFDEPVYNYTRDFPYIFEEMQLPVSFKDDRARAEQILLDAANKHTVKAQELSQDSLEELERRFHTKMGDAQPRVYWRITDNWLELTVRFLVMTHGVRNVKDAMTRDILRDLDAAGIGIASGTYEIVSVPPIRVVNESVK